MYKYRWVKMTSTITGFINSKKIRTENYSTPLTYNREPDTCCTVLQWSNCRDFLPLCIWTNIHARIHFSIFLFKYPCGFFSCICLSFDYRVLKNDKDYVLVLISPTAANLRRQSDSDRESLGSSPDSLINWLHDIGQLMSPLWAPIFSSIQDCWLDQS